VNLDGAFFGTSFPHAFLKHYPLAVILPPKVHFYEPKISGFKIAGKRGSLYFDPPKGATKFIKDSMQANMVEDTLNDAREMDARSLAQDFTKMIVTQKHQPKEQSFEDEEDKEAKVMEGGRKGGRKRNKNKGN